jgi:flagellar hook protein FlgE
VKALGRLALTDFKAREKLQIKGENLYAMTFESGPAIVNDPNKAGMGTVNSKSLEHSNVELSHEFVNMIEGQRAFQANAKTITTSDEILADLIQMKR